MAVALTAMIAAVLLLVAWVMSRMFRWLMRHTLKTWERSEAFTALGRILIYLLAIGAGLSVIAGDARALVGTGGFGAFLGISNADRKFYRMGHELFPFIL